MNLSPNFTLEELTRTDTGLPNNPDWYSSQKVLYGAIYILQPARDEWGRIRVNRGYSSREVNKAVGGVEDSQHLFGEAYDIAPLDADTFEVYKWLVDRSGIKFGQCIYYMANPRIHVSLPRLGKENNEALVYENGVYKPYRV